MWTAARSEAVGAREEVLLVDRVEHRHRRPLNDLVLQARNRDRSRGSVLLGDVGSSQRLRTARRSGRGSARWCSGGPICCRPFRLTVPHSPLHHSVSDPRQLEPDRRVSRIRLAAEASSIEVMHPSGWCALWRSRTRGGSPERGPTTRTRCRYSTAATPNPVRLRCLAANRLTACATPS